MWEIPAGELILEVAEGSLFTGIETTAWQLRRLKEVGVKVALDDSGADYASMTYLSRLEIDQIKMDRSFIHAMLFSSRDRSIVRAIADLAEVFNLELVAVGVEPRMSRKLCSSSAVSGRRVP